LRAGALLRGADPYFIGRQEQIVAILTIGAGVLVAHGYLL
jgi:hypothetical protein